MENEFLKKFINNVNQEHLEEMDELLYYYNQGFEIGKEQATLDIASKLYNLNIDTKVISEVTNISIEEIKKMNIE